MKTPPWVWAVIALFGALAFTIGCAENKVYDQTPQMHYAAVNDDYGAGKKP